MKKYKIIKTKDLADSEVEIECEIDAACVSGHRAKAIAKIQKDITLPGFRPGHVPENILVKQVGDLFIYNEMAELAINDAFPEIIEEAKANFITMPHIQITKIAVGNPLQFKMTGPIMPEIKLPNYKKIAEKVNAEKAEPAEVTDKEIEDTIAEIKKQKPDLKWEDDFNDRIKEGIKKEKEFKAKDKKRMAIIEKILADSKITLPKILVENELRKMQAQFEDDINRAGLKMDDYLKHLKKTKEDLAKEWTPDAEKRAKVQLIITKIALDEKIEADAEQVKKEVENLLKVYKDATPDRTHAYVEMMLTNEKVFEWLENQK